MTCPAVGGGRKREGRGEGEREKSERGGIARSGVHRVCVDGGRAVKAEDGRTEEGKQCELRESECDCYTRETGDGRELGGKREEARGEPFRFGGKRVT